ncbi:MerR family DNA-binding transcriptional regulator [Micromonospora sp. NBC_01699]|uniref:DNA polymerase III subunit beta family protein n=1 Tax=Micromonospora sp. NBC_01699 TaxID=2975984 RepID=UPI002E28C41F|nr:MerR family transcriptional regulator [Micromonospora sp. NBC_01699]
MRSIGEMARASGLTVSALRFYDGAGILVPAVVDPETGYRWYAQQQLEPARLVARLRRVNLPLAEIGLVLRHWSEPVVVRRLLDGHLRRLEAGLTDARRELSRVHALLDHEENLMTGSTHLTLTRAGLAAGLDAVRFAVGDDPELPVLGSVLFEVEESVLRLVATDRYRLAVASAAVSAVDGPPCRVLAPVAFVDQARTLLASTRPASRSGSDSGSRSGSGSGSGSGSDEAVTVVLGGAEVGLRAGGLTVQGQPLDIDFPDYGRLIGERLGTGVRVAVDVPALRAALTAAKTTTVVREQDGSAREVAVLGIGADGTVAVLDGAAPAGDDPGPDGLTGPIGVDREFLLQALDAGGRGQLVLDLDGPIRPLLLRLPDDDLTYSLLMPIRR